MGRRQKESFLVLGSKERSDGGSLCQKSVSVMDTAGETFRGGVIGGSTPD
jgi:hypothetical protein